MHAGAPIAGRMGNEMDDGDTMTMTIRGRTNVTRALINIYNRDSDIYRTKDREGSGAGGDGRGGGDSGGEIVS